LVIVGAGLAGLSAALTAVKNGWTVKLVSSLASERAQSVMAEGGINAALNTKGGHQLYRPAVFHSRQSSGKPCQPCTHDHQSVFHTLFHPI
jgi:succinate dehydrogenase/fumarate reductase flavoprotein subunit